MWNQRYRGGEPRMTDTALTSCYLSRLLKGVRFVVWIHGL